VIEAAKQLSPQRYLRMRYEEVLADPRAAMSKIGGLTGLDLGAVGDMLADAAPMQPQHQVGGNRLRLQSEIRFRREPSSALLSRQHDLMVRLVAGRDARTLGYSH
jgi:hypothetical protein